MLPLAALALLESHGRAKCRCYDWLSAECRAWFERLEAGPHIAGACSAEVGNPVTQHGAIGARDGQEVCRSGVWI